MPAKSKQEFCGSTDTQSVKPCRRRVPCPYHSDGRAKKGKKRAKGSRGVLRKERLLQLRLEGKSVKDAGLGAGYSESTCKGKIYQIMESAEMKARIQAHLARANLQIEETIGTLVHQMRFDIADLFPHDEILQRAKRLGISHLIKKIKRRPVVAGFDEDLARTSRTPCPWSYAVGFVFNSDGGQIKDSLLELQCCKRPQQLVPPRPVNSIRWDYTVAIAK